MTVHVWQMPDWHRAMNDRIVHWDDETGRIWGTHSGVPWLRRCLGIASREDMEHALGALLP